MDNEGGDQSCISSSRIRRFEKELRTRVSVRFSLEEEAYE